MRRPLTLARALAHAAADLEMTAAALPAAEHWRAGQYRMAADEANRAAERIRTSVSTARRLTP